MNHENKCLEITTNSCEPQREPCIPKATGVSWEFLEGLKMPAAFFLSFFFKNKFIYFIYFIFGCVGSLLLCAGFL